LPTALRPASVLISESTFSSLPSPLHALHGAGPGVLAAWQDHISKPRVRAIRLRLSGRTLRDAAANRRRWTHDSLHRRPVRRRPDGRMWSPLPEQTSVVCPLAIHPKARPARLPERLDTSSETTPCGLPRRSRSKRVRVQRAGCPQARALGPRSALTGMLVRPEWPTVRSLRTPERQHDRPCGRASRNDFGG
jgi:hypothetical protein